MPSDGWPPILAFGLLGLGLRAVPTVLADDLEALSAAPRPMAASPVATASRASPTAPGPTPTDRPSTPAPNEVKPSKASAGRASGCGAGHRSRDLRDGRDVECEPASTGGRLIRFDVRVEENLEIDPNEAAELIAGVLNDERSWRGSRPLAVRAGQRGGERAELHAYIVTPGTTDRLCAPLLTRGEVSCQNGNRVVLNAKRWLLGADAYGTDLKNYRRYLVNHEFGHYIGYGHVECPGDGRAGAGDDAADQGTGRV